MAMPKPDLDLDLLHCFVSVVETGSFTLARVTQRSWDSLGSEDLAICRVQGKRDVGLQTRDRAEAFDLS